MPRVPRLLIAVLLIYAIGYLYVYGRIGWTFYGF